MSTLRIKDLRTITIKILPNKKRVQLRFETGDVSPYEAIEFELAPILALGLASEAMKLISTGSIPSRPTLAASTARARPRPIR
jgi:hypothetical protein